MIKSPTKASSVKLSIACEHALSSCQSSFSFIFVLPRACSQAKLSIHHNSWGQNQNCEVKVLQFQIFAFP